MLPPGVFALRAALALVIGYGLLFAVFFVPPTKGWVTAILAVILFVVGRIVSLLAAVILCAIMAITVVNHLALAQSWPAYFGIVTSFAGAAYASSILMQFVQNAARFVKGKPVDPIKWSMTFHWRAKGFPGRRPKS